MAEPTLRALLASAERAIETYPPAERSSEWLNAGRAHHTALATYLRELQEARAAAAEVAPDNTAAIVGADGVDPDLGRYVVVSEDGDPIVDADSVAELLRQLNGVWGRVSELRESDQAVLTRIAAATVDPCSHPAPSADYLQGFAAAQAMVAGILEGAR